MKHDESSKKNDAAATTSSCPVMIRDPSSISSSSPPPSWWNKLTFSSPTPQHQLESLQQPSACPMVNNSNSNNSNSNNKTATTDVVVASLEEAAKYAQTPQPDQRFPLRTDRQVSSIPRGRDSADDNEQPLPIPHHQLTTTTATVPTTDAADAADAATLEKSTNNHNHHWVYPSEQQLYNAMRRKGWQNVPVDSIPTVLQIHNSINERTWDKVLEWEYMDAARGVPTRRNNENNASMIHDDSSSSSANNNNISSSAAAAAAAAAPPPRLLRFEGRPKDLTPKAFIFSNILRLSDPPFDRHDWYVESYHHHDSSNNSNSSNNSRVTRTAVVQRYVIDYYMTEQHDPFSVPIPYVDARPAVDSPRAVWMRTRRFVQDAFPGITSYYYRRYYQQQQQQQQLMIHQQQLEQQQQQQQQQAQQK